MTCPHFGDCGGCKHQDQAYGDQLLSKEAAIRELYSDEVSVAPILGSQSPWHYRNKMEFSFSQDRQGRRFLGLMRKRGRVVDLNECHICPTWFSQVLENVREWWRERELPAYHPYRNEGLLRTLILREGRRTGERLAMLTVTPEPFDPKLSLDVDTLILRRQVAIKGQPTRFEIEVLSGSGWINEELHLPGRQPTRFRVSPTAFFQPNTLQAERLYSLALSLANLKPTDTLYDLYCGTGTLAILASPLCHKVLGIELNEEAIRDARINANSSNVEFLAGDVLALLPELPTPDVILVDPPRAGLDPRVISHLRAPTLVYTSCNPKTQASDIQQLKDQGYHLSSLHPIDQFPQTPHCECIALLVRNPL